MLSYTYMYHAPFGMSHTKMGRGKNGYLGAVTIIAITISRILSSYVVIVYGFSSHKKKSHIVTYTNGIGCQYWIVATNT